MVKNNYPRQTKILRSARYFQQLSQQQLAAMLGIHTRQYQRLESGERDIRMASMKLGLSICIALGIDPLDLVFGEDPEPQTKE